MSPVIGSRRALGLLCARRAPRASVGVRCALPIAVKRATSALGRCPGASRWTRRGSCAHRAGGLALPLIGGRASLAGGVVENRRSCLNLQRRSRVVGGPSRGVSTVDRGPNQAFERTRRFMASTWLASARRAAQLVVGPHGDDASSSPFPCGGGRACDVGAPVVRCWCSIVPSGRLVPTSPI